MRPRGARRRPPRETASRPPLPTTTSSCPSFCSRRPYTPDCQAAQSDPSTAQRRPSRCSLYEPMILEDPKPAPPGSASRSAAPPTTDGSLPSAGGLDSATASTPLLQAGPSVQTYGRTGNGLDGRDGSAEPPPPYSAGGPDGDEATSPATRRARRRFFRAAVCSLALLFVLNAVGIVSWRGLRGRGRRLPGEGDGDERPPAFGPESPLRRPWPHGARGWNSTQGPKPVFEGTGGIFYCNPISPTSELTARPVSAFLLPITTSFLGLHFLSAVAEAGSPYGHARPHRSISSRSSVSYVPWTDDVEEDGFAIKVVIEGLLSPDGTWSDHQACAIREGGPRGIDPYSSYRSTGLLSDEDRIKAWIVTVYVRLRLAGIRGRPLLTLDALARARRCLNSSNLRHSRSPSSSLGRRSTPLLESDQSSILAASAVTCASATLRAQMTSASGRRRSISCSTTRKRMSECGGFRSRSVATHPLLYWHMLTYFVRLTRLSR